MRSTSGPPVTACDPDGDDSQLRAHLIRQQRLGAIGSVIDAPLGSLDLDKLLSLLLDQVLKLLSCDTAAVLLLDSAGDQLVARAARGLEEEVRQGVRIPMGVGFAGRVAVERRVIALDRVDATTVANPILWEKGISSMLGAPLIAEGEVLGVLHVGSFSARSFNEDEVLLLELVADKVASAARSSLAELERRAAGVLQRSLLPSALPKHPHVEFASRYVPAELGDVGGDWYDAFVLPSGDVWVMIGDVAGHGLIPAVVMGRLRSAMRAYALLGMSPEDVLRGANRTMLHFEPGAMATVVCGVLKPPFDEFCMCSAGHMPPMRIQPGMEAELLSTAPIPPLGVVTELDAHSSRWSVPPGAAIVLYTDGLVERRGKILTEGLEHLRKAVGEAQLEPLCGRIMDAMIGTYVPADDVALLALRVTSHATSATSTPRRTPEVAVTRSEMFPCDPASAAAARRFIRECTADLGPDRVSEIELMVSELATNAVVHAASAFDVTVERLGHGSVRVEVRDFGEGAPELFHRGVEADTGRGLQIVDLLADTWGHEDRPSGSGKSIWFVLDAESPA